MSATHTRLCTAAIMIVICWIPSVFVSRLVEERAERQREAQTEIADKWGGEQIIVGPVLSIPPVDDSLNDTLFLLPDTLTVTGTIIPEIRSRGIFKSIVYTAQLHFSGAFHTAELEEAVNDDTRYKRDGARLALVTPDVRGIERETAVQWNGEAYPFQAGNMGIHASVPVSSAGGTTFSMTLQLRGTERLGLAPVGLETHAAISSTWPTPSFQGTFLPKEHTISDDGFSALWAISSLGRPYPQLFRGFDDDTLRTMRNSAFSIALAQRVDLYTQIARSVKYAILFITLTFLAFFLFETLNGIRLHPMQYALVGSAIALFFLLLLSLAEHIGFIMAYLTSTAAIVSLITGYCSTILKQKKRGLAIAALLTALYAYLFTLLQMETYALLFGSLFLFTVLACIMFITRNIDWYKNTTTS